MCAYHNYEQPSSQCNTKAHQKSPLQSYVLKDIATEANTNDFSDWHRIGAMVYVSWHILNKVHKKVVVEVDCYPQETHNNKIYPNASLSKVKHEWRRFFLINFIAWGFFSCCLRLILILGRHFFVSQTILEFQKLWGHLRLIFILGRQFLVSLTIYRVVRIFNSIEMHYSLENNLRSMSLTGLQ